MGVEAVQKQALVGLVSVAAGVALVYFILIGMPQIQGTESPFFKESDVKKAVEYGNIIEGMQESSG